MEKLVKVDLMPNIKLKYKIYLLLLIPFLIPLLGYQYLRQTEHFLRTSESDKLTFLAQAAAGILSAHEELIPYTPDRSQILYVRPLQQPIQLDGYTDDWLVVAESHYAFGNCPDSPCYQVSFGQREGNHYLFIEARDPDIVYRNNSEHKNSPYDHLQITLPDEQSISMEYHISTSAPGQILGSPLETNQRAAFTFEPRIRAFWQETEKGYNIEVRIADSLINSYLGLTLIDSDSKGNVKQYGTQQLRQLIHPSTKIMTRIEKLSRPGIRIWVVDQHGTVLALSDRIRQKSDDSDEPFYTTLARAIYRFILTQPTVRFSDSLYNTDHLAGSAVEKAIAGEAVTNWYLTRDKRALILAASHPIESSDRTLGAVVVETTNNDLLEMHNQSLEKLINLTGLLFVVTWIGLLWFSRRLIGRITRLRDQTRSIVGPDGQLTLDPGMITSDKKDEIGDLADSFSHLLGQISAYHDYLERMASRLSHELKTPLAVVSSSLENMPVIDQDDPNAAAHQRALDGTRRLQRILTSMSEATRLEQTLNPADKIDLDLAELLNTMIESYQATYASIPFDFKTRIDQARTRGCPDLLGQMLDKLIGNAIEFRTQGTITIRLSETIRHEWQIMIENIGPVLPEEMTEQIFSPMVSVRSKRDSENIHLGLGLFIAQTIVKFHEGRISACNREDNDGVRFTIVLPGFAK